MTPALWDGAGRDPDVEGGVNTGSGCSIPSPRRVSLQHSFQAASQPYFGSPWANKVAMSILTGHGPPAANTKPLAAAFLAKGHVWCRRMSDSSAWMISGDRPSSQTHRRNAPWLSDAVGPL